MVSTPVRPPAAGGVRGVVRWLRKNQSLLLLLIPALLYLPAILWFQMPNQFAVVMSGSMEPTYSAGDLIVLRPIKDIQVGDVVAFKTPRGTPGFPPRLLHRVVEYEEAGARLTTKGDANADSDPFKVGMESLLGEATGFKVPLGGHVILFLQSRYGRMWIAIVALAFAYPTIARMGTWTRRSVQQAFTETVGLDPGRLDRVESGVNETRDALGQFSRAIAEYATHLQSHTAAVRGMSEGSQGLVAAVRAQNEVLAQLKETLASGMATPMERRPAGQAPVPPGRPAPTFPPGHHGGSR